MTDEEKPLFPLTTKQYDLLQNGGTLDILCKGPVAKGDRTGIIHVDSDGQDRPNAAMEVVDFYELSGSNKNHVNKLPRGPGTDEGAVVAFLNRMKEDGTPLCSATVKFVPGSEPVPHRGQQIRFITLKPQ